MPKLEIELPTGVKRFITKIHENDVACSIYESSGIECTAENLDKLKKALIGYPDIKILEPRGCWITKKGIECYGI